jgi:CrcB protein
MKFPGDSSPSDRSGGGHASDVDPDLQSDRPAPRWREPRLISSVAAVAAGGVLGAETRYGLGSALPHGPAQWPWSTLLINTSGCVAIGVLMVVITELIQAHPLARPFLGVGFLGGYTTFSTYTVDVLTLARAGRAPLALGYLVATPVIAVVAAAVGAALTRALAAARSRRRGGPTSGPTADGATTAKGTAARDHEAER